MVFNSTYTWVDSLCRISFFIVLVIIVHATRIHLNKMIVIMMMQMSETYCIVDCDKCSYSVSKYVLINAYAYVHSTLYIRIHIVYRRNYIKHIVIVSASADRI